jgi:hypothetical protein
MYCLGVFTAATFYWTAAPPRIDFSRWSVLHVTLFRDTQVSRAKAIKALKSNKNDPVDAILALSEDAGA